MVQIVLLFLTLALSFLFAGSSQSTAQSLAAMKDAVPSRPETVVDTHVIQPSEPTSPLWRAFLWEAMPGEWLSDSSKQPVLDAYQQRDWQPIFISSGFELTPNGVLLLAKLNQVEDHALDTRSFQLDKLNQQLHRLDQCRAALRTLEPGAMDRMARLPEIGAFDYEEGLRNPVLPVQVAVENAQTLPALPSSGREMEQRYRDTFRAASQADLLLTQQFLRYSSLMNPFAGEMQAEALAHRIPMAEFLRQLVPTSPHYESLQNALKKYRKLAQDHPNHQKIVATGLRLGDSGNQVRDLQMRLQQEGFYSGKVHGSFDAGTQKAVESFQVTHQLGPDGAVGKSTIDWLNVSYAQKAKMIAVSMRTICESQTRQHDKYVRINIPQFKLEYIRDGKVRDVHRVIVGKASGKKVKLQGRVMGENQTPPLASTIEQVIVNPRWYVTDRIYRELAGDVSADPSFFARHGYVQMSSAYSTGAPRIFQQPGPTNPLGQVKFEFPNAYAVFLHDTPKKHLFSRERRDFSHGCIRVEGARKLAETLLADDQNPATNKMESFLKGRNPKHIKLNEPIPIVIEYVTVSSNEHNSIVFCNDVYGVFAENKHSKT